MMSNNRAPKYGFAREAQAIINSKYNPMHAEECLEWIKCLTNEDINTSGDMDNFYETLKDGIILCKLANSIQSRSVRKINENKTTVFKCLENIAAFLYAVEKFGVPDHERFQSVDLWERQNLHSVIICLQSLGRKAHKYGKPSIGPKEADRNVRYFTDEQLRAGQNIISLQYGFNKGANQKGINFGRFRQI